MSELHITDPKDIVPLKQKLAVSAGANCPKCAIDVIFRALIAIC